MQELRNSWLNLFGYIRFDLQSGSGNQNNTNTAGGNTSSALTFAITRIPPGQGTDGSQDNKAGPEEFYKNLVIGTYNQLLDISDKYCRHIVDGGSNQGNTQTQQGQNQNNGPQFFWTMDETQKAVQKLAVKGFIPSAAVFDSMAPYLITKVAVRSGAQSCPTVNGQKMCTQGQGTHPCDNFKNLKLGDNTGGTNNQNGKKKQLNEGQRRYFTLAQKIGLAKYLLTLMKAEQTVKKLTVGSTPNIFRKYALNLIYEAAGTDDLEGAYQKNLEELKVFLARIYKDRASLLSLRSRLRPKIIR
ncbi:MAG: hypothetical protein D6780_06060 [Candidatus Dadabacteria bacterium]|nr:MAG: hypothetical protein D6780_06060 [Candidatus Dadabacteria bacterium]